MGWIDVETTAADYKVVFSTHFNKYKLSNLDLDAWIFEGVGGYNKERTKKFIERENARFETALEKPHYQGEAKKVSFPQVMRAIAVPVSAVGINVLFVAPIIAKMGIALFLAGKKGSLNKQAFLVSCGGWLSNLSAGYGVVSFREALIAEKAEKTIAPLLKTRLGRKPKIGIVIGGGHGGLVRLLKNQTTRKRVLSRTNFRLKTHTDELGKIIEVRKIRGENKVQAKVIETNISTPKFRPFAWRTRAHIRLGRRKLNKFSSNLKVSKH